MINLQVRDLRNLTDEAIVEVRVIKRSHALQIVIHSPPHVIREKKLELQKVLENITESIVKIDEITQYMTSRNILSDVTRSDVRIRVFDINSDKKTILRKLKQNSSKLQNLFRSYFLYEVREQISGENDVIMLRAIALILSILFILLTIVFVAAFCHLKRRHRDEIEKLKELGDNDFNTSSEKSFQFPKKFRKKTKSLQTVKSTEACNFNADLTSKAAETRRGDRRQALASNSLLWSPTFPQSSTAKSAQKAGEKNNAPGTSYSYQINLHATADELSSCLHGSDSVSSF